MKKCFVKLLVLLFIFTNFLSTECFGCLSFRNAPQIPCEYISTIHNCAIDCNLLPEDQLDVTLDDEKVGKLSLKASGMSIGTLSYELVTKDSESKCNISVNVPLASLTAEIKFESKGDYTKEPVNFNGSFKFNYDRESAEVKFDGSFEYTDSVSIPKLTSSNSIDIMNLNNDELQTELTTIIKKASEVLPERLKLIGINVTSEDILNVISNDTTSSDNIKDDAENVLENSLNNTNLNSLQDPKTLVEDLEQKKVVID